ncbi:MAG TPA: hypothetical protein VGK90_08610 [Rhizomicrobium sp.]
MARRLRRQSYTTLLLASVSVCITAQANAGVTVFRVKQGVCGTEPAGINDMGAVTGNYIDASGNAHGFVRDSKGVIAIFDPTGSIETEPQAIDGKGSVAGRYMDQNYIYHGFVRAPDGTITSFDPSHSTYTNAIAMGGAGVIVGQYGRGNGWLGFARSADGRIRTIRIPGAYDAVANAINHLGAITGAYAISRDNPQAHGFVRDAAGTITSFDPDGSTDTSPVGIDSHGDAAGYYQEGNPILHSFLRDADGTILKFDPPGAIGSSVAAINGKGVIVGGYGTGTVGAGFLRATDGTFTEFSIRDSAVTTPAGINSGGVVTGYFENNKGTSVGFIRDTSPGDKLSGDYSALQAEPPSSCDSGHRS